MAETPETVISAAGFPVYLHGFSAVDSFLGRHSGSAVQVLCGADLADLARLFEELRYPGADLADAAVDRCGKTWYFRCEDSENLLKPYLHSFGLLNFYQDCANHRFHDPADIYPLLRRIRDSVGQGNTPQWREMPQTDIHSQSALLEAAMILARYFPETAFKETKLLSASLSLSTVTAMTLTLEEQRLLLTGLLEAANPAAGFELLKHSGFIAAYWPELAVLDDVDHSKEFHPEGNVWKHTMETLRYRKAGKTGFDIRLSLGLLLHDIGKPLAESCGSRRFDGHAELGERQARRFLERLGFDSALTADVCYLVRNHMLPAALPRLPLTRTGTIMASALFPTLMELYRCDESSSFKGLDGYYQSSAAYQSYLKYRRNPYRSADGKKRLPITTT